MSFGAYIFDLDDTVLRTSPTWAEAELRLWSELTPDTPLPDSRPPGLSARNVAEFYWRHSDKQWPLTKCHFRFEDLLTKTLATQTPCLLPGVHALLDQLGPLAIASGSPHHLIQMQLARVGLLDRFQVTLSSESVLNDKPSPDVFLLAASQLNVPPPHCLVFEDSLVGVTAARAARMTCIAIPSQPAQRAAMNSLGAHLYNSLNEITPAEITRIAIATNPLAGNGTA